MARSSHIRPRRLLALSLAAALLTAARAGAHDDVDIHNIVDLEP